MMAANQDVLPPETAGERWANVATHAGVALIAGVAIVGLMLDVVALHDRRRLVAAIVYGLGLIALYLVSTAYHCCPFDARWKARLRRLDHAAIYVFIAASYTPVFLLPIGGAWGWSLLGVVWGAAAIGATIKLFAGRGYGNRSTLLYVLMGWVGVIVIRPMVASVGVPGMLWILAGGLAYTGGVAFYAWDRLKFNHAIWHGFVALGTACHFVAIRWFVLLAG